VVVAISRKRVQASPISMEVHPCAVGLVEVRGIAGFTHGSAWNYQLYLWKRVHGLEILEACRIY